MRVSSGLTTSPACIVANEPDIEMNLVRRMRGSGVPSQPVLEINPGHPLVERLNHRLDDPRLDDWAHVLFSQAVLTLGARIEDPAAFVNRMNDLLQALTADGEAADGAKGRSSKAAGGTGAKGSSGKTAGGAEATSRSSKAAGGTGAKGSTRKPAGGTGAKGSSKAADGGGPADSTEAKDSSGKETGDAQAKDSSGEAAGGGGPAGSDGG